MKDHSIRRKKNSRERVAEEYEPVVLWVKPGPYVDSPESLVHVNEPVRREARDYIDDLPFVEVATKNEPRVDEIVTEFDSTGDSE